MKILPLQTDDFGATRRPEKMKKMMIFFLIMKGKLSQMESQMKFK